MAPYLLRYKKIGLIDFTEAPSEFSTQIEKILSPGARLEVKECQNKVCTNVNLSDSVVILRPEEIQGKSLVHFKDSVTHYNL